MKQMVVVAGPNGAGKSTFVRGYLYEYQVTYLSADAIAAELSPHDPSKAAVRAGRIFLARLDELIAGQETFTIIRRMVLSA